MKYYLYANEKFIQGSDEFTTLAIRQVYRVCMWVRQMDMDYRFPLALTIREGEKILVACVVNANTRSLAWKKVNGY